MTRNIDELSNLTTQKAEPPEQYFAKMDLSKEQVEKRLQYTEKANGLFDVILILLLTMNERGETNFFYAKSLLESWILSLVAEFTTPDDYLMDYATDTAYNFVDTTNKHIDEPWYTSSDRALYNAENGANDVLNYTEYKEAIEAGKTEKRWITEKDNRVRKSHKAVTQKPIPILEYFRVGMAQMRFTKDYELAAAFPEELVNCRCTIEYLPKTEERKSKDIAYENRAENYSAPNNSVKDEGKKAEKDNNSISNAAIAGIVGTVATGAYLASKIATQNKTGVSQSLKPGEIKNKAKAQRELKIKQYMSDWPIASLSECIERFAKGAEASYNDTRTKRIYRGKDCSVIEDINYNYFRIQDNRLKGKRSYVLTDGTNPSNELVNGHLQGRSRADYEKITHFRNGDMNG